MENHGQYGLPSNAITNPCVYENLPTPETTMNITLPTLKLREKIRAYTKTHRDELRANNLDSLRLGVGEIKTRILELENLTEKDVAGLAKRIKRRKHATSDDMYRLSHAFLQDEKNIETFSKIPGAIQVLVKELTGKNSERQLSSAECLCNLSLGQEPVCEKISLLAGSYFVTYLHSTEHHLIRVCLWAIANILDTGLKGALVLIKMQLFSHLWSLYCNDCVADEAADFREDAAICLQIIALKSEVLLKNHDREFVIQHITEKNPSCLAGEYHLQIIFHTTFSNREFVSSFTSFQQQYLINYSLSNICNTKEFKTVAERLRIIYCIRILSNLLDCHPNSYSIILHQISLTWQTNLLTIFNTYFAYKNAFLTRELLWFLKNILNFQNSIDSCMTQTSFLEKLEIPSIDLSIQSTDDMVI